MKNSFNNGDIQLEMSATGAKRILLQPALILHRREYRNTSLIIDVITQDHGRIALVAKGARRPKNGMRPYLQCFQPLLISWAARGELGQLLHAEPLSAALALKHHALFCAFYINELLMRILPKEDPHAQIYHLYIQQLSLLQHETNLAYRLRLFEKHLLAHLGIGMILDRDIMGLHIQAGLTYQYLTERGPVRLDHIRDHVDNSHKIRGSTLLAYAAELNLADPDALLELKRMTRLTLAHYLGNVQFRSRSLFQTIQGEENC